jgi:hypothetical protein
VTRTIHPRHGIHEPTGSTPVRARGSVRRTSTIDTLRPDGLLGDVVLVGRARDLLTGADGAARVLGEAALLARVRFVPDRTLVALRTLPEAREAAALIGVRASSGFRAELDRAMPAHRDARSLLYLLLDDLPVATLVSGYAIGAGGIRIPMRERPALQRPDICAGWRSGGTMMTAIESEGHLPSSTGPPAPSLARADDALAWHRMDPLPPHGMRRHRRLDLVADGELLADVLFRDSHMAPDGSETVVHEYEVRARIDPATLVILEIGARARALPWRECDPAADSARLLVGRPLPGLRPHVRAALTGTATCTHLNDTLRSLEDVAALAAAVAPLPPPSTRLARSVPALDD